MLEEAERNGILNENTVIIESTSGNTGIGLAAIAAARGLKIILVMPDTMSVERRKLLKAYGAELVLTDGKLGMNGANQKAAQLSMEIPNSFMPSQFENPSNPDMHFKSTGPEIWKDTHGNVDIFVAGVGTGGTITGVGHFLKQQNPNIKVVAVEPIDSPMLSQGKAGPHKLQGIGAGFVPKILDTTIYDEIITVSAEDAFSTAQEVAIEQGMLIGISSAAALWAAVQLGFRSENEGKNIVVVFPDSGERYFSMNLFENVDNPNN